jgi:hypothetical protein
MLQVHTYAQFAHRAVVTHITVEDRCEKDQASQCPFPHCGFSNPFILKKKKSFKQNHKFLPPFSAQSMSRLNPEYPTIDLIIAIF